MKAYLILLISLLPLFVLAQKEANVWYFGSYYGMDFKSSPPTLLKDSKLYSPEGSGSISDTSGKLLFYSQGDLVYNKQHQLMQNGFGLNGILSGGSTSAALIVRLPLSYRYYFIFSSDQVNGVTTGYADHGTRYSVIDMQGDSGRGKVMIKSQLIVSQSAEKIAAVMHANKTDVWIAVKQNYSDTLFMFLLTKNGLSSKVIKHIIYKDSISMGQIKFSPNGKYIAMANTSFKTKNNGLYIYDFDNISGSISNGRKIHTNTFSIEFSSNSKLLYWTSGKTINNKLVHRLYQCRIRDINNKIVSDSLFYFRNNFQTGTLQLAPNGKIYGGGIDSFLNVVHYPNRLDSNSKIELKGQNLYSSEALYVSTGLPSFISSYFKSVEFTVKSGCINEPTKFILIDSLDNDSVKWDFGDTASGVNNFSSKTTDNSHIYKQYGSYKVTLVTFYDNRSDTTTEIVSFINPKPDFSTSDICENDSVKFNNSSSTLVGKLTYKWKFGDLQSSTLESPYHSYTIGGISQTYNVTLVAIMSNGCSDSVIKSVTVNANPISKFSYVATESTINFNASQSGNTSYKWNFGNGDSAIGKDIIYTYPKSGKYTACLIVTNAAGCFTKTCKEVSVTVGINAQKSNGGFKIYPNPNTGNFTVEIENPSKEISIAVYDLIGTLIKTYGDLQSKSSYNLDLNLSKGIYFIRVINEGETYNQKLVIK